MRVSALIALSTLLCTFASAEESLRGRSRHLRDKDNSRSQVYTDNWNLAPNTYGPDADFTGGLQIGLILGFIATGAFMVFASIVIILDEKKRHRDFAELVVKARNKLRSLGCDNSDFAQFDNEFAEREKNRFISKEEAEKQRKALAEVN